MITPKVAPKIAKEAATHRQIAEVLEELSREVEALGSSLCGDMDIAMRHMDTLQAIDLIAQKQRSLAAVLNADCVVEGVESIGLEKLRERMRLGH